MLKTQLIVDKAMGTIICLAYAAGRRYDFRLLKVSNVKPHPDTQAITDTGYLGLQTRHGNSTMPKMRSQKNPLTADDKQHNGAISRDRILAENVISAVKRFKIVSA